ncbi:MAG TPA: cysteine desulfurase-like protein [Gemmatimonadaceae bacterium]|nr:cysteine desulfurase-like protein [Gemmatimonadaceae bacterium]
MTVTSVERLPVGSDPVASARARFPAMRRVHNGHPVAYFDGPGGTQVPQSVGDAMTQYLFHHNANTHWVYPTSEETDALIAESRRTLATFVNAEPDEIAFGANMTTLTFHLARALGREWKSGDEVVITELDHHANVAPWRAIEKERGVVVRSVRFDPATGELDLGDFSAKLGPRTKLVALGVASNALGTVTMPRDLIRQAHAAGAEVFIDAVHYAPHRLVDVKEWDCDFLACSAYKFYGPHIGILFGRKKRIESLDFPKLEPAPGESPERVETGTQNHEGIVGAAAAVEFIASLGGGDTLRQRLESAYAFHATHGGELLRKLWSGLASIDGVTLYGPTPDKLRTPTLSFTLRGHTTNDIARALAKKGVFVSNGDFYAMTVIERIGQAADGVVRAGCSCYTTESEVDRLIEGVREIARGK